MECGNGGGRPTDAEEQQRGPEGAVAVDLTPPVRTVSAEALASQAAATASMLEQDEADAAKKSLIGSEDEQAAMDMMESGSRETDDELRVIQSANPAWDRAWSVVAPWLNKGSLSNCATFSVMLIGMLLKATSGQDAAAACVGEPLTFTQGLAKWLLAAGLFGFAGGITNWLAIHMLFDRVCGLPGSGVIPMRFKEIREVVKNTIMKTFFDGPYLEQYMATKMTSLTETIDLGAKVKEVLESPEVDALIDKALDDLGRAPEGMMLMMMNLPPYQLKPMIKPFLLSMAPEVGPMLGKMFDMKSILPVDKLRAEIDALMTEKLQELTPEKVKQLMEEVIRTHLGWLIVWGNVFGSFIGVASTALGYP